MHWKIIELKGYIYFTEKGYRILIPLISNYGYDFVIEKDGMTKRINVKKAYLKDKNNTNSWRISLAGNQRPESNPKKTFVDIYLAWLPDRGKFIEVPGDFFEGFNKSKTRQIPKAMIIEASLWV